MKKYLGVALIVLGTIMLAFSYQTQTLVNLNWFQFLAIYAIISGVVTHIISKAEDSKFLKAIKTFYGKYATFKGRATRSEFWYFALFLLWVMVPFLFIYYAAVFDIIQGNLNADTMKQLSICSTVLGLFNLINFIPSIALGVRRMHDTGKSGWALLFGFIPVIGGLILLVFYCLPSKPDNQYGPKETF